ncbi:Alpha/Beta hydrolase protein [Flagelloscypha sp. PMI_526]|nr:Alpha/Beta hydrolase protein [Flagelloscypha sp. PMI_526]
MSFLTTPLYILTLALVTHAAPQPAGSTELHWVDCTKNIPAPVQSALNITEWDNTTLGALPDTLTCGRIDVPLDYTQPFSDSNKITVGFSLYTPKNPVSTIFYNPGGPGVEAQSSAWLLATNKSQLFSGLEDHQFMMMDTRGTWQSSPLNCSLDAYNAIPFGTPKDQAAFDDLKAKSRAYGESCLEHGDDVKHIGTEQTVQDWESIRLALKKEKVNLIGVSYGTYYFAEYVQRFPDSIDRAALDAVTIRGAPDVDTIKDEAIAVNRMLLRADGYCQINSSCPFHSQGKGSVVAAWNQLLEKAQAGQLSSNIGVDDLRQTVPALLRSTPMYDILTKVMAAALNGNDASGLAVPPGLDEAISISVPLFCPDDRAHLLFPWGYQALAAAAAPVDTNSIQSGLVWGAKLYCSGWPVAGRAKRNWDSVKDFPLLWITSDFDLNTPTEWATFNYEQTPKSTLIVRHGDGHGTIFVPGPARDAIFEYIRTGRVSPSSNETLATVYPPGTTRGAIPDPYSVGYGTEYGDDGVLE